MPQLTVDELLTTTRAVRKRLDLTRPVDPALIRECLELALQAPTGSNRQNWHFVAVADPERRHALADLYRRAFAWYVDSEGFAGKLHADDPQRGPVQRRIGESAIHLAEHLHEVPVLLVPCAKGRPSESTMAQASYWGSIMPAVWSFMLAARSRGLGTVYTTLHLRHEDEVAELLGLPDRVTQAGLVPVAHYTGETFSPGARQPVDEVLHWDTW